MDMFNLGPLPLGWECKIETKYGKLYFINHTTKTTTWDDPRLASIPTPPYHIAITQPTAYFEDTIGSRWSSPLPSLKGFSLHRRGSSPRLGSSPRIAPSPTPPPRNKRNEQVILESRTTGSSGITPAVSSGSVLQNQQQLFPYPHGITNASTSTNNAAVAAAAAAISSNLHDKLLNASHPEPIPERSNSRSSGCSSYYITSSSGIVTANSQQHIHISTSHLMSCDNETAYKTICAMFPTATEQHIKHLFHKYHNRANLVVSALQVEKYPLASDISQFSPAKNILVGGGKDIDLDSILCVQDNKSIGVNSPARGTRSYLTDSPARTGTPLSLNKYSNNQSSAGSLFTKSWGSPNLSLSPQMQMARELGTPGKIPSKSPKMKLKYMKGIFPAADETILLDTLSSCENNVQKASEKLLKKGFTRTPPPKPARQKWLEVKSLIEKRQKALDQQRFVNFQHEIRGEPQESPFPTPIMKTARPHPPTLQQRNDAKNALMKKFPNLPDRFISWALEVAQFQQDIAERLLREVYPQTPEEFKPFIAAAQGEEIANENEDTIAITKDEERTSEEEEFNNNVQMRLAEVDEKRKSLEIDVGTPDSGYFEIEPKPRKKSFLANLFHKKSPSEEKPSKGIFTANRKAKGPNPNLAKGPNPSLIQQNYVQAHGPSQQRKGPNPSNRAGSQGTAKGPNPSLAHGPSWSTALKNRYKSVTFNVVGVGGEDDF